MEHRLEQQVFHDASQPPRAAAALRRHAAYLVERAAREADLDLAVAEERRVLRDERAAHVREDTPEVRGRQRRERCDAGETRDELGDKAVLDEV